MYQGSVHLHSLLRWIITILAVLALGRALSGRAGNKPYSATDGKIALFTMISSHIMLLLGLYQWFVGPWGLKNIQNMGMAAVMKDGTSRFYAVEHLVGMLLAIVFITIGARVRKKEISDDAKHKGVLVWFGLALLIIFLSIPWPFREGLGRPLFPGM
jgi:predicted membrane protein